MSLCLIMIWMKNLNDLLYITTYVDLTCLFMCILLLVVVKIFKLLKLFESRKQPDAVRTSEVPTFTTSETHEQYNTQRDCSKHICHMRQTVDRLSTKKTLFSTPLVFPIIYLMVCVVVLVLPVIYDIYSVLYSLIFVATGIPVYFLVLCPDNMPQFVNWVNRKTMIILQKVFLALPDEIDL